jgi:hypothetical protein
MPIICDVCDEPIVKKIITGYVIFKCNYCNNSGCIDCVEICNICNYHVCNLCYKDVCPCCK